MSTAFAGIAFVVAAGERPLEIFLTAFDVFVGAWQRPSEVFIAVVALFAALVWKRDIIAGIFFRALVSVTALALGASFSGVSLMPLALGARGVVDCGVCHEYGILFTAVTISLPPEIACVAEGSSVQAFVSCMGHPDEIRQSASCSRLVKLRVAIVYFTVICALYGRGTTSLSRLREKRGARYLGDLLCLRWSRCCLPIEK